MSVSSFDGTFFFQKEHRVHFWGSSQRRKTNHPSLPSRILPPYRKKANNRRSQVSHNQTRASEGKVLVLYVGFSAQMLIPIGCDCDSGFGSGVFCFLGLSLFFCFLLGLVFYWGWSPAWLVGWFVGRSVGRSVGWLRFSFFGPGAAVRPLAFSRSSRPSWPRSLRARRPWGIARAVAQRISRGTFPILQGSLYFPFCWF